MNEFRQGTAIFSRIWVLEVDRAATLAFEAKNHAEARELANEGWLRDDLAEHTSNGSPLLAAESRLSVRSADEAEVAAYREGARSAAKSDDLLLVYLVPLDQ